MADVLKYNGANLLKAPARVLYAPFATTIPTYPSDIFDGTDPYAVKTGWVDFGATSGPPVISRTFTTSGIVIEQSDTSLYDEVTEMTRTLQIPIAEFSPANLAVLEESTAATYASGTKRGSGTTVPFGSIDSLSSFRLAVVGMRSKQQGTVTETVGPKTRGSFVVWTAYKASLTGDSLAASLGRNETSNLSVSFKLYPDPTVTTTNGTFGRWLIEDSGISVT